MGRRSINTTKSGKYMNPTDQFRKEARKRELKKNKKQRMMVRQAVLKGKDPMKLLEEMEIIDRMEYNPVEAPSLNEKVLRDKRKKLRDTFDRVFKLYEKEKPEYAIDLKKAESEYERTRKQLVQYFEQVRNAERVQLDQIPLPDAPVDQTLPAMIPLPNEIPPPLLGAYPDLMPPSILKKRSAYELDMIGTMVPDTLTRQRKPPGPPPGPPPPLSDSEDEYDPANDVGETLEVDFDAVQHPDDLAILLEKTAEAPSKSRKIRFEDDDDLDDEFPEKDTRLKLSRRKKKEKAGSSSSSGGGVSALQARMLQMAGQEFPDGPSESSSSESDDSEDERERDENDRQAADLKSRMDEIARLDDRPPGTERDEDNDDEEERMEEDDKPSSAKLMPPGPPPGAPPGLPPGLPPGPPPGAPPMFMRPPLMPGGPPGSLPRLLPPGPPPGRPQGLPPGPPPGLPPNLRGGPMRVPPGMQGMPPPRLLRPPGAPPNVPPPHLAPSMIPMPASNPNVLSAPPSIMKPPLRAHGDDDKKSAITIEAKPKIKSGMGDVTRFTPTAVKIKRNQQHKGRLKPSGRADETSALNVSSKPAPTPATQTKTKDDAYDQFMNEMAGLI
ncbi:WW domain-binding protein 11-like [Littorina saxatilis]|uniref:Wbp11/ELF5/Saf1 N-terminal domain-containing protein n=1 Tax=Littorina saxatilis TaxID=31220 RepID=A0AAN9GMK5_9CAEN